MSKTLSMAKLRMGLSAALCGLLLAGALSSCGKKSAPRPPEGEESSYTFPQTYPNPASVLPKTEAGKWEDVGDHAGDISVWPKSRKLYPKSGPGHENRDING